MSIMMTRQEIAEKMCQLAAQQAAVDPAEVSVDTRLFDDLNFDSLDAVEFVMQIEDEFEVSIPDEKAEEAKTVGQAVELLMSMRG